MSKSKGNVIDPNELIEEYGADTVRLFSLFAAPPEKDLEWSKQGVDGAYRFINRLYRYISTHLDTLNTEAPSGTLNESSLTLHRRIHQTVAKVSKNIETNFHFNTAISAVMELFNELTSMTGEKGENGLQPAIQRQAVQTILLLLSPIIPHFTAEMWQMVGGQEDISMALWPEYDEEAAQEEMLTIVIQINGKLRSKIEVPADIDDSNLQERALTDEKILHFLGDTPEKTLQMLQSCKEERPVAFQLFGSDTEIMARATTILNNFKPDIIDINMGCPVRKVTRKGAGAALMASPKRAEEIIRAVVQMSCAPVSVKFRRGVNENTANCIDFAQLAEDCGASAITVHGRTWSQAFTGNADWDCIAQVVEKVSIPVIGNGDIKSFHEAHQRLKHARCAAVMIGRGSLGNPWVFHPDGRPQNVAAIARGALRHLTLMEMYLPTDRLLGLIKNHAGRYFKDLPGSSRYRQKIYSCSSFSQLLEIVTSIAAR
ncbi:unnamed protein product [Cyprideis torosa]|uniref:tRNA-dihydrouridine(47) synthase [NAD(P)(+)] n=1 Tax=Cyprideis torosa TaxID=163714 RepID=A0A7R8WKJ8_9CRUS|nr:unnamed protein product [Cyprideis torosa]CAG0903244.1 unnamed protein product [Cyprideis torosa]